jgi:predicted nuclease with RNAse H fold
MLPEPLAGAPDCGLVAGLDPKPREASTGYAVLAREGRGVWVLEAHGLTPIYRALGELRRACLVAVDAPLTPPYRGFRDVEVQAMRVIGARLLPGGARGMRMLSVIGNSIRLLMLEAGKAVIETHPYTVARAVGIDRGALQGEYGRDTADAIIASITAATVVEGSYTVFRGRGGALYFPSRDSRIHLSPSRPLRVVVSKGH